MSSKHYKYPLLVLSPIEIKILISPKMLKKMLNKSFY